MLREALLFNLILCPLAILKRSHHKEKESESDDLGGDLITSLRNDANLDLSMDEEYEDLRAELLAYHTALSSMTGPRAAEIPGSLPVEVAAAVNAEPGNGIDPGEAEVENVAVGPTDLTNARRSMKTTPCWKLGGICVNHKLCTGHRFLSEVPGCKDKLEVCCFTWNKFQTRDLRDKGLNNLALPWSSQYEFGGKGLIGPLDSPNTKSKQRSKIDSSEDILAYDLSSIEQVKKQTKNLLKIKGNRKNKTRHVNKHKPIVVIVKQGKV